MRALVYTAVVAPPPAHAVELISPVDSLGTTVPEQFNSRVCARSIHVGTCTYIQCVFCKRDLFCI